MLHSKSGITYSKVRRQVEWVETPDGRRIPYPRHFSTSRLVIPKHAMAWGCCIALILGALTYFIYSSESEKAALWQKADAEVKSVSRSEKRTKNHKLQVEYRPMLRFAAKSGRLIEFPGPPQHTQPPIGERRIVYYNPHDPDQHRTFAPNPRAAVIVGGIFIVIFLIFGAAAQIHGPINKRTVVINDERWVWLDGQLVENPPSSESSA